MPKLSRRAFAVRGDNCRLASRIQSSIHGLLNRNHRQAPSVWNACRLRIVRVRRFQ